MGIYSEKSQEKWVFILEKLGKMGMFSGGYANAVAGVLGAGAGVAGRISGFRL